MADELLTEEEQIEKAKAWWSDYGNYVIAGVLITVAGFYGFNVKQDSELQAQVEASALYEDLTNHIVDGSLEEAEAVASSISADYADTAYAGQSKLAMARLYMDKNRDQDAANVLNELLALDGIPEMKLIARLRLAKVLMYQVKAEEAIAILENQESEAFRARFAEGLGDAHAALGQVEQARASYLEALAQTNASSTIDQGFVQLKLADLPPLSETPAVEEASVAVEDTEVEAPEEAEDLASDEPSSEESE